MHKTISVALCCSALQNVAHTHTHTPCKQTQTRRYNVGSGHTHTHKHTHIHTWRTATNSLMQTNALHTLTHTHTQTHLAQCYKLANGDKALALHSILAARKEGLSCVLVRPRTLGGQPPISLPMEVLHIIVREKRRVAKQVSVVEQILGFLYVVDVLFCACLYLYTHIHTHTYTHTYTHTHKCVYVYVLRMNIHKCIQQQTVYRQRIVLTSTT